MSPWKIWVFGLVLPAILLTAYFRGVRPEREEAVQRLEEERDRLEELLVAVEEAQGQEEEIVQELRQLEAEDASLEKMLPSELDWGPFFDDVEAESRALGVTLEVGDVGSLNQGGGYGFQDTQILVRGGMDALQELIRHIEERRRLCRIIRLLFEPQPEEEPEIQLTVRLYVIGEEEEGPDSRS